jgi:two-component system, sensor histidine kinase and response regulator
VSTATSLSDPASSSRNGSAAIAERLFIHDYSLVLRRTDWLFAGLLAFQWLAAVIAALLISPKTWAGAASSVHIHLWAALLLGGAIASLPIIFIMLGPGRPLTRHMVAVAQMLFSALLIHLTGGRIETHFHVFGSLALLAFYRDWRVLLTASTVVAADHFLRGLFWPQSVYGVLGGAEWRWIEHAGWVVFEDAFLIVSCLQGIREMRSIALRQAEIEVQNEELAETTKRAEAAAQAKSQFLANMSHEIRTPLNGVIGTTELLMETTLDNRQAQFASVIRSSADTLLALINDVLDFSKIEAGRFELDRAPFDLREVVEDIAAMLAPHAQEKGLELVCSLSPAVDPYLKGDPARLRQVLLNLASNALKFTDKGEVALRVEPEPGPEGFTSLRFTVRDTGIGISADQIGRLFQLFTQVDSSMTRRHGGTGLGLAISKQLVELMGGRIGVTSQPGEGSVFWFTIPFERSAAPALGGAEAAGMRGREVLVVDDNKTNRQILIEQCQSWGLTVQAAADGPTALNLLGQASRSHTPFSLIILDMQMPGMTGGDVARVIRQDPTQAGVPLVLLSSIDGLGGSADPDLFAARLTKPVRQSELFNVLTQVMTAGGRPAQIAASEAPRRGMPRARSASTGRVLLAEDNRVNRMVATEILRIAGVECVAVPDGAQAVEAVKKGGWSLILMDCQMPVMDGFEAVREIRKLETQGPAGPGCPPRLPIVALTAHAVKGDEARCLAAGMDAYVSKPIDPVVLIETVDRLIEGAKAEVRAPAPQRPVSEPAPATGDLVYPDLLRRCMGQAEIAADILGLFESDLPERINAVEQSVAELDASALAGAAHALKGSAANVSAEALRSLAEGLEGMAHAGDMARAALMVSELRAAVERFLAEARKHRPGASTAPPAPQKGPWA